MRLLCARCGEPVTLTNPACYGHLARALGAPDAGVARDVSGGALPPSAPPTVPDLDDCEITPDAIDADWAARMAHYAGDTRYERAF